MIVLRRAAPMLLALGVSALILRLAPAGTIGPPWMLALLALLAMAWVLWQPLNGTRDDVLPALAVVLAALGLAMVARLKPDLAHKQQLWLLLSLALAIAAGPLFSGFRRFAAYKYLWVVASLILFVLLLVFGQEVNGARLWIRLGPVQYEPIELIKLFIVFFLAAYLAETSDVIANARAWSLRANVKHLGPLFIGWGASIAILFLQRDLGMATLLLATFATLLFVATRRIDIVVFGAVLFAAGAFWALHHYPYVQTRVAIWRNPFSDPLGAGYQCSQAYYSLAAGGLFGSGFRLGHPELIPDVWTDYIYAAFAEEFGLLGLAGDSGDLPRPRAAHLRDGAAPAGSLCQALGDGTRRDAGIPSGDHRRRRHRPLSAYRHHPSVRLVWRKLAGRELSAGSIGLGDERTAAEHGMKRFAAAFAALLFLAACAKSANERVGEQRRRDGGGEQPRFGQRRRGDLRRQLLELPSTRRPRNQRRVSAACRQSRRYRQPDGGHCHRQKRSRRTRGSQRPGLQRHHAALEGRTHRRTNRRGDQLHPQLVAQSGRRRQRLASRSDKVAVEGGVRRGGRHEYSHQCAR